jgi:hypothetical protein
MEEVVLGYRTMDDEWYNPEQRETFEPTHWMPLPEPPQEEIKPPETFEIWGNDRSGWTDFDRTVIEILSSESQRGDKE